MPSISDNVIANLGDLVARYQDNILGPAEHIKNLGAELRANGGVLNYTPDDSEKDTPLISIDGGNATENLAGGDLIVAGATIGEGIRARRVYKAMADTPSDVYAQFIPHRNENASLAGAVRSGLELRVLHEVGQDHPEAYRVIDGAYLGNVSTILFALANAKKSPMVAEHVLELGMFDSDKLLSGALTELLSPPKTGGNVFALVKNDSSSVYVQDTLDTTDLAGTTDRLLASRTLQPGEMFLPRALRSNPILKDVLTKRFGAADLTEGVKQKDLLVALLRGKRTLIEELDVFEDEGMIESGRLWTTYFKPTAWSFAARALRIEFPFTPVGATATERQQSVTARAEKLINVVNNDIISEEVMEPWCQYEADRNAKDVAVAINLAKGALLDTLPADEAIRSLLRHYRT